MILLKDIILNPERCWELVSKIIVAKLIINSAESHEQTDNK